MKKNKFFTILLILLFLSFTTPRDKIELIHADRLSQKIINDVLIKILEGNVELRKDKIILKCKKITWYENQNFLILEDSILIKDDKNILKSEVVEYYTEKEIIKAFKNPILISEDNRLTADTIIYFLEEKVAKAEGNVKIENKNRIITTNFIEYYTQEKLAKSNTETHLLDTDRNTHLISDSLVYNYIDKTIQAYKNPILIKLDSLGNQVFRLNAQFIEGNEDSNRFISFKNVKIIKDNIVSTCDTAEYYGEIEKAVLKGNPLIRQKRRLIKGDIINFYLQKNKIHKIIARDDASIESKGFAYLPSKGDTLTERDTVTTYDKLSGEKIEIFLKGNKLDSVIVKTMAISYFNITEDSVIKGLNVTSGDSIIIKIKDDTVDRIWVMGGCQGNFTPHETNEQVDTTVYYYANKIYHTLNNRISILSQYARMIYGDMTLEAGEIKIDWDNNLLTAYPIYSDSTDTLTNIPTFVQKGQEPIYGEILNYNIKTQKGKVIKGRAKMAEGFYSGEKINKEGKNIFYVSSGYYTTCDLEKNPHFYFKSKKMKIIHRDKVIAKPIILYIHNIPLLGIPFGVFPDKKGKRHSGWIMPSYGESANTGGFIRGLGYYWAVNDYFDAKITTNFYDKYGITTELLLRYAVRYKIKLSSIDLMYTNNFLSYFPERKWSIRISHHQVLSPTSSLIINGMFVNDDSYYKKYSLDKNRRLQQNIVSNATYSKRWTGTPFSLSANLREERYLLAKEKIKKPPSGTRQRINYIRRNLPNISLNYNSTQLVKGGKTATGKWYNNIYLSFNTKLRSYKNVYYESVEADSAYLWKERIEKSGYLNTNASLSSSQKIFKYISTNQSISLKFDITPEYYLPLLDSAGNFLHKDGKIVSRKVTNNKARLWGSMSFGASTKLYGIFPYRIGPIRAIRHIITPGMSFSYTPDFSKEFFGINLGYFKIDKSLNKFDIFSSTPIGPTPSRETKSLNFSLSNLFQGKIKRNDKEDVVELLTTSTSGSYNFTADSLKLSQISTSIRSDLTKKLNLNISLTHDLYKYENKRINKINTNRYGVPGPRLTQLNVSSSFKFSDVTFEGLKSDYDKEDTAITSLDTSGAGNLTKVDSKSNKLFNANFHLKFSLNKFNPNNPIKRFWLSGNISFKIFNKWRVGYSTDIDLVNKKFVSHSIQISRDLHCWEFYFSWVPTGYGKQYYLRINVKSSTLRDLKYEERGGRLRSYGL